MGMARSCRGGDASLPRCKCERKLSNGRRAADPAHDIRIRGRHAMRPQHRTCMAKQETPRFQTRPDTSVALAIGGKRGGSRRLGTCGHACGTYAHSTGNPRQRRSYAHPRHHAVRSVAGGGAGFRTGTGGSRIRADSRHCGRGDDIGARRGA